jgi:MerR family mercuric resistance operon transcriptional regulator
MPARRRTIGQLAALAGVGVETIRFYERRGLITQPPRVDGGYRHYDDATLARVRYIRIAQQMGLSLADIEGVARQMGDRTGFCSSLRATVRGKLAALTMQLEELSALKGELEAFLVRCEARAAHLPCPTLEELTKLDSVMTPAARPPQGDRP